MTMYTAIEQMSAVHKEKNDCAVRAIAIVTGLPYVEAHAALKEQGRKNRSGTELHTIFNAVRDLGYDMISRPELINDIVKRMADEKNYKVRNLTTRQIGMFPDLMPSGKYLMRTNGHILAVVDAKVIDWSDTKALRAKELYEIKKFKD